MSLKVSFSLWQTSSLDQHRYLLNVVPAEVSIPHCVVSGELAATVGQYIALLIALRDRFGNVCTDAQTRDMAISVTDVTKVAGYVTQEELVLVNRVSQVETYPGIIYTHQVVLTTEHAVEASLVLRLDGQQLHATKVLPPAILFLRIIASQLLHQGCFSKFLIPKVLHEGCFSTLLIPLRSLVSLDAPASRLGAPRRGARARGLPQGSGGDPAVATASALVTPRRFHRSLTRAAHLTQVAFAAEDLSPECCRVEGTPDTVAASSSA